MFQTRHAATGTRSAWLAWMRANLFSSWLNTLLTLFARSTVYWWCRRSCSGRDRRRQLGRHHRADCTKEGACWVFIQQRFGQFMYGYYPACAGAWT
jgi:general L-amino acid transport system permease protein